jgi:N-acetylmuramoyl-L-alanine amidase
MNSVAMRLMLGALLGLILPAPPLSAQETCDKAGFILAIDSGHTPQRPGALSAGGRTEYAFNRVLAGELLQSMWDRGFSGAFLINPHDREIGLRERTAIAAGRGADLLLSIHHDSVQPMYLSTWRVAGKPHRYSDRFRGYSLFYSTQNSRAQESRLFAQHLGHALRARGLIATLHHAEDIPGERRTLVDAEQGLYRFDELVVLKSAAMPAVLLEAGVIVHREEERLLRTPAHRQKLIEAVAAALERYCDAAPLTAARTSPPPAKRRAVVD